jgi:MATE family multidrug resistance protein
MEIKGTGLANFGSQMLIFIMLFTYTYFSNDIKETVIMPDYRTFYELYDYFKIGLPSAILVCLDWWVWEIMIIFVGLFEENRNED